MIAIFLAAVLAQTPTTFTLDAIGRQSLPRTGCAAFLWNTSDRRLVAMASADASTLRLAIDGRTVDLARTAQDGPLSLGFGKQARYEGAGVSATLDMAVVPRENLVAGAQVPDGSLEVSRAGADTLIVPVAGLIGCST